MMLKLLIKKYAESALMLCVFGDPAPEALVYEPFGQAVSEDGYITGSISKGFKLHQRRAA